MKAEEFKNIVGLNVEAAREKLESQGMKLRVMKLDGERCLGTCDVNPQRVNVEVQDEKIADVRSIG